MLPLSGPRRLVSGAHVVSGARVVSGAQVVSAARAAMPYDELMPCHELWEACIVVLDRYPRLRPVEPTTYGKRQRVTIPQAAVDAADLHYHLD